jgi:hypothetical protein
MKQLTILANILAFLLFTSCDTITGKKDDNKNTNLLAAAVIANQRTTSTTQTINFRAVAGTETTDVNCTGTFKGHASIQGANLDPAFHISESVNFN